MSPNSPSAIRTSRKPSRIFWRKSLFRTSVAATIFLKTCVANLTFTPQNLGEAKWFAVWFPSVFLFDLLILNAVDIVQTIPLSGIYRRIATWLSFGFYGLYLFLLTCCIGFLLHTGSPVDFSLFENVAKEIKFFVPLFMSQVHLFVIVLISLGAIALLFGYIDKKRTPANTKHPMQLEGPAPKPSRKGYSLLVFYTILAIAYRPTTPYNEMTKNIAVEFLTQSASLCFNTITNKSTEREFNLELLDSQLESAFDIDSFEDGTETKTSDNGEAIPSKQQEPASSDNGEVIPSKQQEPAKKPASSQEKSSKAAEESSPIKKESTIAETDIENAQGSETSEPVENGNDPSATEANQSATLETTPQADKKDEANDTIKESNSEPVQEAEPNAQPNETVEAKDEQSSKTSLKDDSILGPFSPVGIPNSQKVDSYDFLIRSEKSKIKNVVILFMESTRRDAWPMDYDSVLGKRLTDEARVDRKVTPFFESIAKKSAQATSSVGTSGYTIKSILSTLCSVYPYPSNFVVEHTKDYYNKCLPELLKDSGYVTKHFQATELFFDNQYNVMHKQGFQSFFSEHNIKNGEAVFYKGENQPKRLNYFGYADEVVVPTIVDFVNRNHKEGKPFFASVLTSTSHHPWNTPKGFPKLKFSDEEWLSHYLNTISYADKFVEEFINGIKDVLNETLVVFTGDHGVQLGEHGNFYSTSNVKWESAYKVPIVHYTENEYWKALFNERKIEGNFTNLDILPTILDILNEEKFDPRSRFEYQSEGNSMLHPYIKQDYYSFSNPGFSSISLKDPDGFKWLYDIKENRFTVFDLVNDPEEETPLKIDTPEMRRKAQMAKSKILKKVSYIKKRWDP